MTKAEFTEHVARKTGLARADAAKAVDAMLQTVEETLARGSEITFSGFGRFHVAHRAARQGVHPRTGERIAIAASRAPRFTPGAGLRRSVGG